MRTVVLGLGISGVSALKWLEKREETVIGIDKKWGTSEGKAALQPLLSSRVTIIENETNLDWSHVTRLVVSPGISPTHPVYQEALARNLPVLGEAELALPHFHKPMVAVTGTNGKTTVTLLIEHVLKSAGKKTAALGNVGRSLCDYLLNPIDEECFVVELSSYQLETMVTPVFCAGVFLNLTPDHLDRYASLQEYAKAKFRLQSVIKKGGPFFVNEQVRDAFPDLTKEAMILGRDSTCFLWTDGKSVRDGQEILFSLPESLNRGWHDAENCVAAFALCRELGVSVEPFVLGLQSFKKPPHRIEYVIEVDGVRFYDDSKGTNIDAVIQAVQAMKGSVILIAGGVDKGASYEPWQKAFSGKVKGIVSIGEAQEKMERELSSHFPFEKSSSLEKAVESAFLRASKGDSVLLSPGCASFDMFRDYAHRGEEFQKCVYSLAKRR